MKKQRVFAVISAMVMSVSMLFTTGIPAKAEESQITDDFSKIEWVTENEVGDGKPLTDDDLQVIAETLEAESISDGSNIIVTDNTTVSVDWDKSKWKKEDIREYQLQWIWFTRDENDKLVIDESVVNTSTNYNSSFLNDGTSYEYVRIFESEFDGVAESSAIYGVYDGNFSCWGRGGDFVGEYAKDSELIIDGKIKFNFEGSLADNIVIDNEIDVYKDDEDIEDIKKIEAAHGGSHGGSGYCTGVYFSRRPDLVAVHLSNTEERRFKYFLVDNETTPFHFKEDVPDTPVTSESYELDVTDGSAVTAAVFNNLLAENANKDVVIKSNNDITFTFAKGTMKAVDGKDSYDFSAVINKDYNTVTGLPAHVTKDNFISMIDYKYSGQLPAEASIRIPVGKDYAGKTLYYSQLLGDSSISLVSSVVVDDEGYVTVKQSHCSSYILTSVSPEKEASTPDITTPAESDGNTSNSGQNTSPQTGDTVNIIPFVLLGILALGVMAVMGKRTRA